MVRRRPGTGAVFHSKARDRWYAQVTLPGEPRRYVTRICRSHDDARIALAKLLDDYAIAPNPDARQSLTEYVDAWFRISASYLKADSRASYRRRLAPVLAMYGRTAIGRLRVSDMDRFSAAQAGQGTSASSINASLVTLGIVLTAAVRDGALVRNVAHDARKPRVTRPEVEAMSLAEARSIIETTRETSIGPIVALLLGSGLRIGEALALDWSDIDFTESTVHVRSGKTARSRRTAPVTLAALEALRAERQLAGPVFAVSRSMVQRNLRKLTSRHPHELRHGHATLLLATGTDMRVIADQLGHAQPSMTADIYAHVEKASQRAAVDRLDAALTNR